ncbi:TonB-dependent receptor [Labilibaculum filiforme]|uniref:TonB-dependent receptor n=1 Tax=Labilibaculum filiforme TaxID=1940526 RepID=A0A2N3I0U4_9BACT|nr:TonB-dependent receptor [Labilibaculum filiforme]PKQ63853.1 TonB-dependent receptor [Labilibaculum filiforme]
MKKIFLVFLFLCTFIAGFSQKITLKGFVRDSTELGVEMANIIAINNETNLLESYCVTNHSGLYKLSLLTNSTYTIKVSFIGFQPKEFPFTTTTIDAEWDVNLSEENSLLSEVDVTYTMPVSVRGDTIVYDTDSFTTGTEKKLKDVLVTLPGIEMNDDGQIEVEGKKVQKVMVEGKDFFDGDSKIASDNIPADAIDKIEVLRNFNEVGQMKGLTNDDDNVALNIRLKSGKKKFWFGELTAGAGPDEKYLAHPKLFYYSPEFSLNVITDANNIGEVPFTRRDYMNFTGGFKGFNPGGGSSIEVGSDGLGLSTAQNNKAKDVDTKFGAINFSYSPNKALDLSGFGIYSYTGTKMETQSKTTYKLDGNSSLVEEAINKTDQTVNLGLLKFSSVYKPNSNFQFDYDVLVKKSNDEEQGEVVSVVSDATDDITQFKQQKPISVNQNTNIYYTLNERNIFSFEAQHLYQDEDPFYNAVRDEFAFVSLFPIDESVDFYNLNQQKNIVSNKIDAKLDYYYITGDKSNIEFTLGTTQSHQNFDSEIFQILDNSSKLEMTGEEFTNDVKFNISDLFFAFHYKLQTGIFTFNPGFSLHQYEAKNTQLGSTVKDELTSLLPEFYVNMQLKKSENLRFNYQITRSFTDVSSFAESFVLNNYNSVYSGNRNLESALNHRLSLNFFSFNMFNFTNMFANLTYTKRIDALKNDVMPIGINQVRTTINSNFNDESVSASGRYQRTFKKVKGSVKADFSWAKTNNLVNSQPSVSESLNQNYSGSLATNFKNAPNLEVGYNYSISEYDRGSTTTTYYTKRPFAKFDAAFLKSFIFTIDYDWYSYTDKNKTIENKYSFLDANLTYQQKDSKWEFGIKGNNLLNTESLDQSSETDYSFSSSTYFVQPRYVLFTVKYDI